MNEPVEQQSTEMSGRAMRLGSYEILHLLARGGMAEIYLARAVGLEGFQKLVVLKKILPEFATNPHFVRLFLDEARLSASLEHPNIAAVYDNGTVDGNYFFTMEFVRGQDVRAILRRAARDAKPVPIDHAVQIARSVAAALHYAHEHRSPEGVLLDVIHRDVSPSNIVVSYNGTVKLLDFGVARAATRSIKTQTGALKGKISYMSPEQGRGAELDRRSDLFSLGIVMWELVTTRRLFKGANDFATIQQILFERIKPPREIRPECPPELERIIMKALAREKHDRYQTAQEIQLELEELAREHKLGQSSVALSNYVSQLFAAELKAWQEAETKVTVSDSDTTTEPTRSELSAALAALTGDSGQGSDADFDSVEIPDGALTSSSKSPTANLKASPQTEPPPTTAGRAASGRTLAIAGGALVLAMIAGGLGYLVLRHPAEDHAAPAPSSTADITLTSSPAGATVYVNGEPTGLTTPTTLAGLRPGTAAIRLELANYVTASDSITVSPGQHASREYTLDRITGRLVVAGLPAGADVIVDGETHPAGEVIPLPGGHHDVKIVASGHTIVQQPLDTAAGDQVWELRGHSLVRK